MRRTGYQISRFVFHCFFKVLFRVEYLGKENIPRDSGALIVSNHASNLDPWVVGLGVWPSITAFVAKRELKKVPIFNLWVKCVDVIWINRGTVDRASLNDTIKMLESDRMVTLFPEGTRTSDGNIAKGKPGVGMIAHKISVPVVPAYIHGSFKALPRGRFFPRPCKITVRFGSPIDMKHFREMEGTKSVYSRISDEMINRIIELRDKYHLSSERDGGRNVF